MEKQIKKIKSLLKFYHKDGTEIELKVSYNGGTIIRGTIIKRNHIFNRWLVLQSSSGSSMKIFMEDIFLDSIFPLDFAKNKNKKEKKSIRNPLPDKLRFEVLKRDKYVCQYCGACGPDVELEIDHIIPVSRGGTDDITNLKTSCFKCNRGKGDRV